jgi:hypothetical protein
VWGLAGLDILAVLVPKIYLSRVISKSVCL